MTNPSKAKTRRSPKTLLSIYPDQLENTNLLHKEKYHCTADLQFDQFGFDKACKST